jgi:hypothetical protein
MQLGVRPHPWHTSRTKSAGQLVSRDETGRDHTLNELIFFRKVLVTSRCMNFVPINTKLTGFVGALQTLVDQGLHVYSCLFLRAAAARCSAALTMMILVVDQHTDYTAET